MTDYENSKEQAGQFLEKSSHRLLGIAFLPLHYSIWNTENLAFSRALFLLHIGLFLFWQPFINHKTQIRTRPTIILILAIFGSIYLGGSWAQTIWIIFLIGIMSSYRLDTIADKVIYITIIVFLLIELFGGLIPKNLRPDQQLINADVMGYLTLALNLIIIVAPLKASSLKNYSSDLLYSIIAVSIVVLLALITVIWMSNTGNEYYTSFIYAVLTLATVLIVFSLIFRPNSEFGLISQLRDRYLLNLGTPFEGFLIEIAEIAHETDNPDDFLNLAFKKLTSLSWISGFKWASENKDNRMGEASRHINEFNDDGFKVTVFTEHTLGPSMQMHCKLLIQIISIFYSSKRRELALSRRAHMEAIYDTGARLTHDIKNLIQSLTLMLSTANTISPASDKLFIRNLQTITERLQQTLTKLKNPSEYSEQKINLNAWWERLKDRLEQENIAHEADIRLDTQVPEEMFDNVVDNLLNNAVKKRRKEAEIEIKIVLRCNEEALEIIVTDSGSKITDKTAASLFDSPVKSKSGFGIGLYQAAKQADSQGYELTLLTNINGQVRFGLTQRKNEINAVNEHD